MRNGGGGAVDDKELSVVFWLHNVLLAFGEGSK
jgi:hypothetical protein